MFSVPAPLTELAIALVVGRASMMMFVAVAPYTITETSAFGLAFSAALVEEPSRELVAASGDELGRADVEAECCEWEVKMDSINFSS